MVESLRVASTTISDVREGTDPRVVARASRAGIWIWPLFLALDAYMCFVVYPGAPFPLFIAYRIVIELAFLAVLRASSREDPDPEPLFRWLSLTYGATALVIALMAIPLGGIVSPYMHGISLVALVWAALLPTHWRRALPTFLQIGFAFPLVMGVGAALSPTARAAWLNGPSLKVFGANYVFVLSSAVLGLILSHLVWSAQQQARRLGSYQLEELLGRGGMGEVWRARHRLLARHAAIKLIRPDALGGKGERRDVILTRFEREAQATASLRSAHTVELYDFGVSQNGTFYYVMELLEGMDGEKLVERFGPLPAERVGHLVAQACDSLGEAHEVGMVHRDIKPSNLYVCRYGRAVDFVKVLDFGLVKPREARGDRLTADHVVSGTPAFMAPEQVVGDRPIDQRTDLYALGCVAYWLLTGQHVYEGGSAMRIMLEHARGTPVPPSKRTELPVPEALDAIVMACLEKDPSRRPEGADVLAEEIICASNSATWTPERARQWWERHLPPRRAPS